MSFVVIVLTAVPQVAENMYLHLIERYVVLGTW